MKITDKKKPIDTIPDGVWESSFDTEYKNDQNSKLSVTTDLQGNGYPQAFQEKKERTDKG